MDWNLIRQAVSNQTRQMCARNGMLTLGELVARLESMSPDVNVRFDDGRYPGHLNSYRGYYEHIAIQPADKPCTVGELLTRAHEAIGETYIGYKGGEFVMDKMTPVWISPWGETSGVGLIGVAIDDGEVTLKAAVTDDGYE